MDEIRLMPILRALSDCEIAQIRGEGATKFVFLQQNDRTAEASCTSDNLWVEVWERCEDPDGQPISDHHFSK